jgi:O-antigen/teichoic acid export membrane protein
MTARVLAGFCSLIGFAAVVGYLAIIQNQDGSIAAVSWVWAGVMTLPAAAALVGTVGSDARMRRLALVFAGVVYGMLGILAILSIGIVFVAAGLSALLASVLVRSDTASEPVRPAPPR